MSKTPETKMFLNHLHNELGISKDDIRKWTQEAVERTTERYLETKFSTYEITQMVNQEIKNKKDFYWFDSETNFGDYVRRAVVDKLVDGIKLKVELTGLKKEATPPHQRLVAHNRKAK